MASGAAVIVYLVAKGEYDTRTETGVYSTLAKALEAADTTHRDGCDISEWTLDATPVEGNMRGAWSINGEWYGEMAAEIAALAAETS